MEAVRDNWKAAQLDEDLLGDKLWTGKCIFRDSWDEVSDDAAPDPVASVVQLVREMASVTAEDGHGKTSLPNGLVFTNLAEYSLVDDLSGRP